jgi:hypothetical protein
MLTVAKRAGAPLFGVGLRRGSWPLPRSCDPSARSTVHFERGATLKPAAAQSTVTPVLRTHRSRSTRRRHGPRAPPLLPLTVSGARRAAADHPAVMGHTNPATTTIYTRATANDTTGTSTTSAGCKRCPHTEIGAVAKIGPGLSTESHAPVRPWMPEPRCGRSGAAWPPKEAFGHEGRYPRLSEPATGLA